RAGRNIVLRGGEVGGRPSHGVAVAVDASFDAHRRRQRLAHHRVGGAEVERERERCEGEALDRGGGAAGLAGGAGVDEDRRVRRRRGAARERQRHVHDRSFGRGGRRGGSSGRSCCCGGFGRTIGGLGAHLREDIREPRLLIG